MHHAQRAVLRVCTFTLLGCFAPALLSAQRSAARPNDDVIAGSAWSMSSFDTGHSNRADQVRANRRRGLDDGPEFVQRTPGLDDSTPGAGLDDTPAGGDDFPAITTMPEPGTLALVLTGLAGVGLVAARRRRS
jgi:hypothetical protein